MTAVSSALTNSADCSGVHRLLGPIQRLEVGTKDPVEKVLEAARALVKVPVAHLPSPLVLELPCRVCGTPGRVGRAAWDIDIAPTCDGTCPAEPKRGGALVAHTIGATDELRHWSCRKVGLSAGAVFEIEDSETGELHAVQLAETVEEIFTTKRRIARNSVPRDMHQVVVAATAAAQEE